MILSKEQIENVSCGVVKVAKNDKYTRLYRFTDEQINMFAEYKGGEFLDRTHCSAGVKLAFNTDSKNLKLKGVATLMGERSYYSIDLLINDEFVDNIANFDNINGNDYVDRKFPLGDFEKNFELGNGIKKVEIYLPFAVAIDFEEISLDDGAFIEPIKAQYKGILFGDSITQGYDCLYPSKHYTAVLSKFMDTDFVNKAIAADTFNPTLAKLKDDIEPDYILVAYGTNDWSQLPSFEVFSKNCKEFYCSIKKNYPNAKIFALAPIWRKDFLSPEKAFKFEMVAKTIKEIASQLKNVVFIDGFNFLPQDELLFADLRLHPNADGFKHYAENLCKKLNEAV